MLQSKSRERKNTGCFVIEGQKEIVIACKAGYTLKTLLFCPEIVSHSDAISMVDNHKVAMISISKQLYEKVAYRGTTEGVLAIAESKSHTLDTIQLKTECPLILVAEAPEKPGNIGALLRTADAAALDAVLIANPKSDLYHPNLIRASLGTAFSNAIGMGTSDEITQWLKRRHIKIYGASLTASQTYIDCNFTGATALVVGAEATGLSEAWLSHTHQNLSIPMQGYADSLNVSVAAAILIFEAKRQRGF